MGLVHMKQGFDALQPLYLNVSVCKKNVSAMQSEDCFHMKCTYTFVVNLQLLNPFCQNLELKIAGYFMNEFCW